MASALDSLIQAYTPVLENSHHASPHTQLNSQQLGTAFMNVIMLPLFSEETLSTLSPQQLQLYTQSFLKMVSQKKQVSTEHMTNIIGQYISDWFAQSDVVQEVQGMFQHFLINHQPSISPQPFPEKKLSGEKNQKQAVYDPEQLHVRKVLDYLTELETPYNELKLISQHMEWDQKVEEPIPEGNQFMAIAEINIDFKDCKNTLRGVFIHKQKKFAKSVAVVKVLRDIYLGYPEVWNIMETIKMKKDIKLPKNPINLLKSIPIEVLNEKIQPKYPSYRKNEQFFHSKEEYLCKISSFKAELNLLMQQCPNTFNFISQKIKLPDNRWKVQGQMKVNYQGKEKTFKWQNNDTSSKIAEQVVVKRLIETVYVEYVDIFHKMAFVKRKKNIAT